MTRHDKPAQDPMRRDVDQAELADRAFAATMQATNLLAEEIAKAQLALRDAFGLLRSVSVGGEDCDLPPADHSDAVHELIVTRRALRHLARIVNGHADDLTALDQARPAQAGAR